MKIKYKLKDYIELRLKDGYTFHVGTVKELEYIWPFVLRKSGNSKGFLDLRYKDFLKSLSIGNKCSIDLYKGLAVPLHIPLTKGSRQIYVKDIIEKKLIIEE